MYVNKVGASKVAAVVTDDAANMKAARQRLTQEDEYRHIINFK